MFYGFDPTIIILIPAIIFTLYAQGKVKTAYAKYSRVPTRKGITGQQTARMILNSNNMGHVPIEVIPGQLSDNYDPTKDVMHLSNGISNGNSIASVAVAAHEAGHAIQDGTNYGFLKFRIAMVPAVNIVSGASWPILIIGLIMVGAGQAFGSVLFNIGVIMFTIVVLFHTVTLPVEFNASSRALKQLVALDIVDESEVKGCKRVLSAAAMTYVAALATSILNLVRILLIRGSNN
ncbi:MAG: zinc metallopeptidase [Eubacteriales bacterium]|nr:zinc metallopeptidase [Eubacteriales bacterium]